MRKQPDGKRSSLEELMLPNLEAAVSLHAAHVRKVEPTWSYPSHQHALFELNMVLDGAQRLVTGGRELLQEAGDVALIAAGERHRAEVADCRPMTYFCVHFLVDEPIFRRQLHRTPSLVFRAGTEPGRRLGDALRRMLETMRAGDDRPSVLSPILALSALFDVCTQLATASQAGGERAPASRHLFVREMAELLDRSARSEEPAGFAGQMSVAALAAHFGYSTAYCHRVFREAYGMSPRQYWSRRKLAYAKRLLVEEELPVAAVAERLGYRDIAHLSRQFKRWTGLSPSAYRGERREESRGPRAR